MSFSQLSLFFIFVPLWTRTLSAPSKPRRKKKGSAHMPSPRWLARLAVPAMVELARHICFDRWFVGMPPDRIAQDIHAVMGDQGLSFGDVTAMVNTAE